MFSKELIAHSSVLLKQPEVLAMFNAYRGMVTDTLHDHGLLERKSRAEAAAGPFASFDGAEWLGWTEAHDPHTGHAIHLGQTMSIDVQGDHAGRFQLLLKLSFPDGDGSEAVYSVFSLQGAALPAPLTAEQLLAVSQEVLTATSGRVDWLESEKVRLTAWLANTLTP